MFSLQLLTFRPPLLTLAWHKRDTRQLAIQTPEAVTQRTGLRGAAQQQALTLFDLRQQPLQVQPGFKGQGRRGMIQMQQGKGAATASGWVCIWLCRRSRGCSGSSRRNHSA